jgi:hypothetical protein
MSLGSGRKTGRVQGGSRLASRLDRYMTEQGQTPRSADGVRRRAATLASRLRPSAQWNLGAADHGRAPTEGSVEALTSSRFGQEQRPILAADHRWSHPSSDDRIARSPNPSRALAVSVSRSEPAICTAPPPPAAPSAETLASRFDDEAPPRRWRAPWRGAQRRPRSIELSPATRGGRAPADWAVWAASSVDCFIGSESGRNE